MTYFSDLYNNKIVPDLVKSFSIKNRHLIPKIKKITISMGLGADGSDKKLLEGAHNELMLITGRKPVTTKAKKSISGFKLREGQNVGLYVTLRGKIMYEFLERLVYLALPRIHDFKSFSSRSFDDKFNFSFGIPDHLVFSELSYDKIVKNRGLNVAINISSSSIDEAKALLVGFNLPIK